MAATSVPVSLRATGPVARRQALSRLSRWVLLAASLSGVAWSTLAEQYATQLKDILAAITTAIRRRDAAGLEAAYVALNDLDSRLPGSAQRGYGPRRADQEPDPLWKELRVNETLEQLVALQVKDPAPQPKRPWWKLWGRRG